MHVKVNLLTKEEFEKKPLGKFLRWMLSYGRYIIIGVESIVLLVFFSRFVFDRKLDDLSESIEQKKAIVVSASDLEQNIKSLQNDLARVKKLDENRDIYLRIVEKVKNLTPKDTYYDNIYFEDERMELSGKTSSSNSFAYFLTLLKKDDELIDIDLTKVTKDNKTNLIEFNLTAVIRSVKEKIDEELMKKQEMIDQNSSNTEENVSNSN